MISHRHHIVPKHDGGTNDPLNLTPPISIRMHAMFHYDRWKALGQPEDWIACLSLLRRISMAEAIRLAQVASGRRNLGRRYKLSKPRSEEHRAKQSKALTGRTVSAGWPDLWKKGRDISCANRRGVPRSDEVKANLSKTLTGRRQSPERAAMSRAALESGREASRTPEAREKVAASKRGKPLSVEHKASVSAGMKRYYVNVSTEERHARSVKMSTARWGSKRKVSP